MERREGQVAPDCEGPLVVGDTQMEGSLEGNNDPIRCTQLGARGCKETRGTIAVDQGI